jgi:chondroitin 4-sulfotransferase 11
MKYGSCIYQPIPKTGSATIREIISNWKNFSISVDRPPEEPIDPSFRRYCDIGVKKWEESFKFTFVRNPFERIVSAWCYLAAKQTFGEFIKKFLARIDINNKETYISNSWEFHVSSLTNSKFHVQDMNFIGKTETLQHDFDTICDKVEVKRLILPHKNKSKHRHYSEYYDEETKKIVAEKYAKDIEYFGYEFGGRN